MTLRINAINIYTADLKHALRHYERVLQTQPGLEDDYQCTFDLANCSLVLKLADGNHPAGSVTLSLDAQEIDQVVSTLQREGITLQRQEENSPYLITGPDGFKMELNAKGASQPQPPVAGISQDSKVTLREITAESVFDIIRLSFTLRSPQRHMVATNAVSLAEAHFSPYAWFRAIYADEKPVGFAMVYIGPEDDADPQSKTIYFLWRFMVAAPYQGLGFGRKAIELLVEEMKSRGATEMGVSCGEGDGSPEGFYRSLGFERTGKKYGDEIGMLLKW